MVGARLAEALPWRSAILTWRPPALFLDYGELGSSRFHSIFQVREVHDQQRWDDSFELHTVELTELGPLLLEAGDPDKKLLNWAHFLAAKTLEELEAAAEEDEMVARAKDELEKLSKDPHARWLARHREDGQLLYQYDLAQAKREGQREGQREGREEAMRPVPGSPVRASI